MGAWHSGDGTIADAFASGLMNAVLWQARELGAAIAADGGDAPNAQVS